MATSSTHLDEEFGSEIPTPQRVPMGTSCASVGATTFHSSPNNKGVIMGGVAVAGDLENRSSQDDFTVDYKSSDILISKPTGFLDVKNRLGDATFNNPASNMGAILGGVTSYGDTLIIGSKSTSTTGRKSTYTGNPIQVGNLWISNNHTRGGNDDSAYQECSQFLSRLGVYQASIILKKDEMIEDLCYWILEQELFESWISSNDSQTLLLLGQTGTGKTMMCHFLDRQLRRHRSVIVARYFCSSHSKSTTATAVISGLFSQLLRDQKELFRAVKDNYLLSKDFLPDDLECLIDLFHAFLRQLSGKVYLIVDGLDNCSDQAKAVLLDYLVYGLPSDNPGKLVIKCLVTCRSGSEPRIMSDSQPIQLKINKGHIADSVHEFVNVRIKGVYQSADENDRNRIKAAILNKAGGTYLWPAIVLNADSNLVYGMDIEETLQVLRKELHNVYDTMLGKIKSEQIGKAVFVFRMASVARRRLTLEELNLAYALSLRARGKHSDIKTWKSSKCLNATSGNLIDLDQYNRVDFSHPFFRDYLLERRHSITFSTDTIEWAPCQLTLWSCLCQTWTFIIAISLWALGTSGLRAGTSRYHVREKIAHLEMFKVCWAGLHNIESEQHINIMTRSENGELSRNPELDQFLKNNGGFRYIVEEWQDHALAAGEELAKNSKWIAANVNTMTNLRDVWLHQVVAAGDVTMTRLLLESGADVECQWGQHGSVLHAASYHGNDEVIQLLLRHGAKVEVKGQIFENALDAAATNGHLRAVQMLLKYRGPVNCSKKDIYSPVLQKSAHLGNEDIVRELLKFGADANIEGGAYSHPLQGAALHGHLGVVRLLLDAKAKVNAIGQGHATALQAASCAGHMEIVKELLVHGADVNTQAGEHFTALHAAQRNKHIEIVELLKESGSIERDEMSDIGETYEAALLGDAEKLRQLLLNKKADVNAKGGRYGNPLQAASYNGHEEVVELLLKNGAEVGACAGQFGHALQAASYMGHDKVVKLLLNNGADAQAAGGANSNALHAASSQGHTAVIEVLRMHKGGIDINIAGEAYGSALHAAAGGGHWDAIWVLLGCGANVNADGGRFGSPLQAASISGDVRIVRLLIARGAIVNARGGVYGYALQAACACKYPDIVELLIKHGARVNAAGGKFGSALHAASTVGCKDIVELLLNSGARVDLKDARGLTAAQVVNENDHEEIADLLRDVSQSH